MANYYLKHHGVKGQKWGVRRYQNENGSLTKEGKQRLRDDKKIRKQLELDVYDSGQWDKQYRRVYTRSIKKANKLEAKDAKKGGEQSVKTKNAIATKKQLEADRDAIAKNHAQKIKALEDHVKSMVDNYSTKHVKDIKYDLKNGQRYIQTRAAKWNNSNATYNLYGYKYRDSDGNMVTRYEGVKTRHYYY